MVIPYKGVSETFDKSSFFNINNSIQKKLNKCKQDINKINLPKKKMKNLLEV